MVHEYADAVCSIEERGYTIKGIVIDGMKSLFGEFSAYKIQMCQYHMIQIVRRYLIWRPRLLAARELKVLVDNIVNGGRCRIREQVQALEAQMGGHVEQAFHLEVGG